MKVTFFDANGVLVDKSIATDERGVVRQGFTIRTNMLMMDSMQRDTFVPLTDQQKSDAIEARNIALSNAWRNPTPLANNQASTHVEPRDTGDVYGRYDRRLADAWQQTA
jgi:hypothetical protein